MIATMCIMVARVTLSGTFSAVCPRYPAGMRTVVVGDRPAELETWLQQRRALGQDLFDEVWEGEHHVVPAPHGRHGRIDHQLARALGPRADAVGLYASGPLNLGGPDDYRVPDQAYLRRAEPALYNPTAALVVEIVSPGDETRRKEDFYFRAGVEELLIVDPEVQTVEWFTRGSDGFESTLTSSLFALSAVELATRLEWPA